MRAMRGLQKKFHSMAAREQSAVVDVSDLNDCNQPEAAAGYFSYAAVAAAHGS